MGKSSMNSLEQRRKAQENKRRAEEGKDQIVDKQLDGPDRPAE